MLIFFIILMIIGKIGITHIIVDGKIFEGLRKWVKSKSEFAGEAVSCHQCCGTYVGLLTFWIIYALIKSHIPFNTPAIVTVPFMTLIYGGLISILSVFARSILDWITLSINIPSDWGNNDGK